MEKQKQQEEHIKVRKELRRRINKMIRLTLSDFKVEALGQFDRNSRTLCLGGSSTYVYVKSYLFLVAP